MKRLLPLTAAALLLSACVIIIDGDEDDMASDELRTSFATGSAVQLDDPVEETLAPFTGIDISSGTDVTVVYGDSFRIELDERAAATATFFVEDDELNIGCADPCKNGVKGKIIVETNRIDEIEASSGSYLKVSGGFEVQDSIVLAASSGANIDAKTLVADQVTASASSGGSIRITAVESVTGAASSGGSIRYWGNPSNVTVATSSGGSARGS